MALFESYERRIKQINEVLNSYGIASIEEAEQITKDSGTKCTAPTIGSASNAGTEASGSDCGGNFNIQWNSAGNVNSLFVLLKCL